MPGRPGTVPSIRLPSAIHTTLLSLHHTPTTLLPEGTGSASASRIPEKPQIPAPAQAPLAPGLQVLSVWRHPLPFPDSSTWGWRLSVPPKGVFAWPQGWSCSPSTLTHDMCASLPPLHGLSLSASPEPCPRAQKLMSDLQSTCGLGRATWRGQAQCRVVKETQMRGNGCSGPF